MKHWRHDNQFWRTIYTEKTRIRIYLCDGDTCNKVKVKTEGNTDKDEKRIALEDVESAIEEKVTTMLKSKMNWKKIENLREKWENLGKETSKEIKHTYCMDCGSAKTEVYEYVR